MEEYVAEVLFDGVPLWLRGIVGEDYINSYNKMVEEDGLILKHSRMF